MKKIIVVIIILVLALGVSVFTLTQKNDTPQAQKIGSVAQGQPSPDKIKNKGFSNLDSFSGNTLDGGAFTSENLKDYDLTVINIWGTFCPPCRAEMPELAAFANSLPSRIQFITICTDATGNTGSAKKILSDAGFNGVTLVSGNDQLVKLVNKIQYVPTTLFYDSNGICVGEEIIGSPQNLMETYTTYINNILSAMNKETI